MPRGRVPLNVLVSMCTNYAYVPPDDIRFREMRAQIEEFYRTLHADDYANPADERLAAMLSGLCGITAVPSFVQCWMPSFT